MKLWTNGKTYAVQNEHMAMGSSAWDCVRILINLTSGKTIVIELARFDSTESIDKKWKLAVHFKDIEYVTKKKPCPTCGSEK